MGILLAELSDTELDAFFEDFISQYVVMPQVSCLPGAGGMMELEAENGMNTIHPGVPAECHAR